MPMKYKKYVCLFEKPFKVTEYGIFFEDLLPSLFHAGFIFPHCSPIYLEEFIHGGPYSRNFTVLNLTKCMAKRFTEFFCSTT